MNCIGTSQRLRAEYGAGSVLLLNYGNTPEARGGPWPLCQPPCPGPSWSASSKARLSSTCPPRLVSPHPGGSPAASRLPTLAEIFRAMAGGAEAAGISSWSVQQAGLEEVFLTVVSPHP